MDRFVTVSLAAAALLTAPSVGYYLFSTRITKKSRPLYKGLCSLFFLFLGVTALLRSSFSPPAFLLFAGVCFSFLGDVILDLDSPKGFLAGLVSFALGHLAFAAGFFLTSLTRAAGEGLTREGPLLFAAAALVMALLFPLLKLSPPKELRIPVAGYLVLLALTFALSFPAGKALSSLLPPVGASLFAFSDAALAAGLFGKSSKLKDFLCLFTYYPAMLLFAAAISLL